LPFMRGKSRFNALSPKVTLTLSDLDKCKSGSEITKESLYKAGIITRTEMIRAKVKVVGTGKLTKPLKVLVPCTTSAKTAIKKIGGSAGPHDE